MTLVDPRPELERAACDRTAVGAFNVIHVENAESIAAAAEQSGRPVIMQISQNCAAYHGGLAAIAAATARIAHACAKPVALHLDHATEPALVLEALELGFTSVMYDGAHLPYERNVATTRRLVRAAHRAGVAVEAELGEIGGKDGAHAPGARTDPHEAERFVAETGVDSLAVAVGSSHAMTERTARLDLQLISRLREQLPVPLVLHGSSGVADEQLREAVRHGMSKINVSTQLNKVYTAAVREHLAKHPTVVDSRKYTAAGRAAFTAEAERLLRLFAAQRAVDGRS